MELTRYGASCVVLHVRGRSLGMGLHLGYGSSACHALDSVTLSAILGKVVSRSLPNPSLPPCIVRISYHSS